MVFTTKQNEQISWNDIIAIIEQLILKYQSQALPLIEAWLTQLGLPNWAVSLFDAIAKWLISQLPPKKSKV